MAHRGVKPSNMMLDYNSGRLQIGDFGLSQFFKTRTEQLEANKIIKSKHIGIRFIPPEQIDDFLFSKHHLRPVEHHKKADIWAAGVTLYRLLTREFPIKANSITTLKTQLRSSEPINLDLIENIEIRQLLQGMLEKDPERRCSIL